jgi:hypothetical protein
MRDRMPYLTDAQVVSHDPASGSMYVALTASMQVPIKIKYGYDGPADALRINQQPMPGIGTWGLVAFAKGDIRNGCWLRSYLPSQVDAITGTGAATDPFIEYMSHFSGYWRLLDGEGNLSFQFPDGSWGIYAATSGLPATYRHIVEGQTQQTVELPFSGRVTSPPGPFQGFFQQAASGTSFALDASGNVTISGAVNATLTLVFGGTAIILDGATGNVTVSGAAIPTIIGNDIVVHAAHSYSEDVNGYGSRITFEGGSDFTIDNYTIGATVTSNNHDWSPPEIPAP